jgi:hypothetical protein
MGVSVINGRVCNKWACLGDVQVSSSLMQYSTTLNALIIHTA